MPDWSYRTVLGPAYRSMPPRARAWTRTAVGRFAASRGGGRVVHALGHAKTPPDLRRALLGTKPHGPVGASADLAGGPEMLPLALRVGAAFAELHIPDGPPRDLPDPTRGCAAVPVGFRLPGRDAATDVAWMRHLAPRASFFTTPRLPDEAVRGAARELGRPLLAGVRSGAPPPPPGDFDGLLVLADDSEPEAARATVRALRDAGHAGTVLVSGGVAEPADAVALLKGGADLVALRDGLATSGPSLPGRVHEALAAPAASHGRAWLGALLLGLALACVGLATGASALTRVLLPYDEAHLGATAADLWTASDSLVPFLRHDRFSLAGTTLALGILYVSLAWNAHRHGAHWARTAVAASGAAGFLGFLLFLVFGYLDPLHLALAVVMLPMYLFALRRVDGPGTRARDLHDDAVRRRALWGQLGLASVGVGLVAAGLAIAWVGATDLLVASDEAYLGTGVEGLRAANPQLPPLVAHDRATFGHTLVSNGIVIAVAAVLGVRRGAAWLWWTFLAAAAVGFGATLAVHAWVGYMDPLHLAPVVLALAVTAASLAALHGHMRGGARD